MKFYKIEAVREFKEEESHTAREAMVAELSEKTTSFFNKTDQNCYVFSSNVKQDKHSFGVIVNHDEDIEHIFGAFMKELPHEIKNYRIEEITFSVLHGLLRHADVQGYVDDMDDVLDIFDIGMLGHRSWRSEYGEALIDTSMDEGSIRETAKNFLFGETMLPEIDRIFATPSTNHPKGHPVHYILQTDDREVRKTVYKSLLAGLYQKGRIQNQRYIFLDCSADSPFNSQLLETLYRSSVGGAVVIRYTSEDHSFDGGDVKRGADAIEGLCEIAYKYKSKVLTVICLPRNSTRNKEQFFANWQYVRFIELREDIALMESATSYLERRAADNGVELDEKINKMLMRQDSFNITELNLLFDEWYNKKLCTDIYPQYSNTKAAKIKIKEETRGSAYDKLQSLIGLENAKTTMNKALNYFKADKLFADRGLKAERPSMHMVFTGNPGTAKTTVARLFAEIMKENGMLDNGTIYEVGRADIVGKYVGHTAPLVKRAFKKARGGVLFIDEAYSLVDERDGLFGDEAINTIVQEMENHREDTVVIFAGYPDKMQGFLDKNPGLRSRIAFHIPFDDYNSSELCRISEMIANEKQLVLTDEAIEKLKCVFETASKSSDFGNGRYARNVIEKAQMAQTDRLMNMDLDKISDNDVFTITADDIETPLNATGHKVNRIGYCA